MHSTPPDPLPPSPVRRGRPDAETEAETRLARLGVEVQTMQAVLVRLLQDVVDAEQRLEHSHAAQLVEANEQLVLTALRHQSAADAAQQALADAVADPLTGLHTRRALLERFGQVAAEARRHGRRCALLFIDLDGFKPLNDDHGHAFGDRVLRQVAQRMVAAVREVDTVSRHGGDEFLVLLADLTHAEDAHAVAEKLLRAIAEPADVDGHVLSVTASAGIAICPDDGDDIDLLIERADAAMYASKRRHPGGVARHGEDGAALPGTDGAGATEHADGAVDPRDRRMADLREANQQLLLAALGAQELRAVAEQARQRQDELLAAMAAELRDPQAPVRIASAMLGQTPGREPLVARVQQAVELRMSRLAHLISDLLHAARHAPGPLQLQRSRVDLVAAVGAAVALYRPTLALRRLRMRWQPPPQPIEIEADPDRLAQILANLIDNACAHTPDGGHLEIALEAQPTQVTLSVADDGMGIAASALPHVFEPFAQADSVLDMDVPSLGLGLAAVQVLVQAHGGQVKAHSDGLRRGSRFVVTLPRPEAG